jgi:hypothetical protein
MSKEKTSKIIETRIKELRKNGREDLAEMLDVFLADYELAGNRLNEVYFKTFAI